MADEESHIDPESEAQIDEPKRHPIIDQEPIALRQFLEEYPLNTPQRISEYYKDTGSSADYRRYVKLAPQIRLYCDRADCQGYRRFDGRWESPNSIGIKELAYDFLIYTCRDCHEGTHTFCLATAAFDNEGGGVARKIGEYPEIHIDIPSALPKLLGSDYSYFIKGLKGEKEGLGVGAAAYYRRVVENQKGRLIEQIARVAKRVGANEETLGRFEAAANETQFSKAIDMIKDCFPESLLIDGHNPLKLLHKALSIAIHNEDDSDCMRIAHSIRVVLTDLSKKMKEALKEENELKQALSDIMTFNQHGANKS